MMPAETTVGMTNETRETADRGATHGKVRPDAAIVPLATAAEVVLVVVAVRDPFLLDHAVVAPETLMDATATYPGADEATTR